MTVHLHQSNVALDPFPFVEGGNEPGGGGGTSAEMTRLIEI